MDDTRRSLQPPEGKGSARHATAGRRARVPARDAESSDGGGGRGRREPHHADGVARLRLQRPALAQGERPHRGARASTTPSPATTRISIGTTTSSAAPAAPSRTSRSRRSAKRPRPRLAGGSHRGGLHRHAARPLPRCCARPDGRTTGEPWERRSSESSSSRASAWKGQAPGESVRDRDISQTTGRAIVRVRLAGRPQAS